jgi:hypothetical protein
VNGYRWKSAAIEIAEVVRTTGPRVALAGLVCFAAVVVPLLVRYWNFFPRTGL